MLPIWDAEAPELPIGGTRPGSLEQAASARMDTAARAAVRSMGIPTSRSTILRWDTPISNSLLFSLCLATSVFTGPLPTRAG
ncbi:hypothetical protein C1S70_06930 (plasmid) [Azospirillum argentinense]|uniref:Uncharacterized protein n=1 Tax=Azospirillum argentinense TaxID=2970906 RepID=A0A2K1G4M3_9PROT|nr:hypothetical protein C1S70_06930 [Azospirillum argentinense]